MAAEVWCEIVGFEGYYKISDLGRVKTCQRRFVNTGGRITTLSTKLLSTYLVMEREALFLHREGKRSVKIVHILVATAFVPKPPPAKGKLLVRHMDGNTTNNRATNLEWYYFRPDAIHSLRGAPTIAVVQSDRQTGADIKQWESASTAAAALGINRPHIGEVCRGERKSCGGFNWRYAVEQREAPTSSEILSRRVDEDEELT